ncbi:bactofilin family protein [Sulfurospirillum arcachonense]|uniref:bactofilin family protein n=1 Tax=Sulfurospirillum arcachonense TaxID=57666 RepID=UPI000469B7AA|nr:polymer-forming cytoskeletal protein [Sulfurospirillum arcachonense]
MAIFNKTDAESPASSETTIIASGAKIDGVFNCNSRLHVDGEITGQINSKSIVTIGKGGKINGEITANRLIVNGLFEGEANCDGVEVLAGGKFLGKVESKELMIEAKAEFEGESKIKRDNVTQLNKELPKDK